MAFLFKNLNLWKGLLDHSRETDEAGWGFEVQGGGSRGASPEELGNHNSSQHKCTHTPSHQNMTSPLMGHEGTCGGMMDLEH